MAFTALDDAAEAQPLAEINMVPMIDVMLVLLIIFMVTAPLLTHSVKVDLPRAEASTHESSPRALALTIARDGALALDDEPVEAAALRERLAEAGRRAEVPALHLRADRSVDYGRVAQAMAWAAAAGVTRIGFVTDPRADAVGGPP